MKLRDAEYSNSFWSKSLATSAAFLGCLTLILGILFEPDRAWPNYLIMLSYATSIGLGSAFFIAAQYLCGAGWSVAIRRVPEALTSLLSFAGVMSIGFVAGLHTLYKWSDETAVAGDEFLRERSLWLNGPFFMARMAAYFLIWIGMSRMLVRNSIRQDIDGDLRHTRRSGRSSAVFVLLSAPTFCLASFDWLMSLDPRWYSTVFGFLNLAGMFLGSLAAITIVVTALRRMGYAGLFTTDHVNDLGRLLFSFSVLWVYLWACQHLLIWYSDIPEETSYYTVRHSGGWGYLSILNVLLNWLVPFVGLLRGVSKRSDSTLAVVSICVLVGRWLDLYIIVMPFKYTAGPEFGVWEIGSLVGVIGLIFGTAFHALGRRNLVPIKDPYLVESLARKGLRAGN